MHLLYHLSETVKNWGPFWAHSAFPYEAWNRKIIDKVSSANGRPPQIATRYLMVRFIENVLHDPTVQRETKNRVRAILTNDGKRQNISVDDTSEPLKFRAKRKPEKRALFFWESEALRSAGFQTQDCTFYDRAMIHNIDYRRREKTNQDETRFCNKFVYLRSIHGYAEILEILSFN